MRGSVKPVRVASLVEDSRSQTTTSHLGQTVIVDAKIDDSLAESGTSSTEEASLAETLPPINTDATETPRQHSLCGDKSTSAIDQAVHGQEQPHALLQPTVEDCYSELTPNRRAPSLSVSGSTAVAPAAAERTLKGGSEALDTLNAQLADLRQRLHESEHKVQHLHTQLHTSEQTIGTHQAGSQKLQDALIAATSAREAADADAKHHKAELDEMCESEDAEMHTLRCQLRDLKASQETVRDDLQKQHRSELAKLQTERATAEQTFRSRIAELESQHAAPAPSTDTHELERLRCEMASGRDDKQRLERDLQAATEELDLLRDLSRFEDIPIVVHEPISTAQPSEAEATLRSEVEKLSSELKTLRILESTAKDDNARLMTQLSVYEMQARETATAHATLHVQIAGLRNELEATRGELQTLRDTNAAFDARLSLAVRRREEYWTARREAWDVEREKIAAEKTLMGKALMRQWGREECGISREERQAFVYRLGNVVV